MASASAPVAPFGRVLTAMVTPMTACGGLDEAGAARLADHLVDNGSDGILVNGTTGEAPTTTDDEKERLLRIVLDRVGERATVLAGVGTSDTAHSVELARRAAKDGAHGLLVVTPYYNKPPQLGLCAHFTAIADATELPMMLYDIPGRTGTPIEPDTLVRLAEHPRIVANKDAKGDLAAASWVMARTDIAYYCGEDMLNLPLLALGAAGMVSVCSHVAGRELASLVERYLAGDVAGALALHRRLLPVFTGMFRTQGVILTKAALSMLELPAGPVRSPLIDATPEQRAQLRRDLVAAGVALPGSAG